MKRVSFLLLLCLAACCAPKAPESVTLSKDALMDKIKGGWAGQTIGVVYGAPTEFKFCGTLIPDEIPIGWGEGYVKHWWDRKPGLFDDVYNDLTFAEAFQELGLDATSEQLALRFAYAPYHLAHANQAGRYNVRQGILPPESGHWMNNPHADDLDFQIEADFVGLMAPAMIPQALDIASRVGHIMNSGDGFYGGAYVAGLYSAAFAESDPARIVDLALEGIPEESTFWQCINDVRLWHKKHPSDWKATWFEVLKKWGLDTGCPKGVSLSFDIDAKLNSAYVTIGLLYGGGDFGRSLEIATRCGQDSDCNPATVGGVLGVVLGLDALPSFWKDPVMEIWDLDFEGTDVSLAKGAQYSYTQALQLIAANGGEVRDGKVVIPVSKPEVLSGVPAGHHRRLCRPRIEKARGQRGLCPGRRGGRLCRRDRGLDRRGPRPGVAPADEGDLPQAGTRLEVRPPRRPPHRPNGLAQSQTLGVPAPDQRHPVLQRKTKYRYVLPQLDETQLDHSPAGPAAGRLHHRPESPLRRNRPP